MRGRELFQRVEPLLLAVSRTLRVLPRPARRWLLVGARGLRGYLGIGVRYCLILSLDVTSQANVAVREDVYLFSVDGLRVGRNVSIHPLCYIDAAGGIMLGNDISIAHGTTIMSTTHKFDRLDRPINDQGVTAARTTIGDDCWIGAQAVIVAGVQIGAGCVVAANSVVTRDVPDGSVVAGSPARLVKRRGGYGDG